MRRRAAARACQFRRRLAEHATMFRQLSPRVFASPQIGLDEVAEAARLGVGLIVNNRPEGESDDQVPGAAIEAAARAAGIGYVAIPVTHAGFSESQVRAMAEALGASDAPVLAYCRSGTRSATIWALSQSGLRTRDEILMAAARAGYDLRGIAGALQDPA